MVWKKKKAGFGRKMKRVRTHEKARSKHGGEHGLHVLETRNIKIKDLIIGKRFRQPRDEDVAQLAESLKRLGQPRAITVRLSRLNGKYPVIAGVTLVEALKMLNRTRVRADIVKCTNAQARQWEIAENLYRARLTALEEAKHMAEWVRLVADPESVSRQDVAKPKGGRPEGAITKAARMLPIKGKMLLTHEGTATKEAERTIAVLSGRSDLPKFIPRRSPAFPPACVVASAQLFHMLANARRPSGVRSKPDLFQKPTIFCRSWPACVSKAFVT